MKVVLNMSGHANSICSQNPNVALCGAWDQPCPVHLTGKKLYWVASIVSLLEFVSNRRHPMVDSSQDMGYRDGCIMVVVGGENDDWSVGIEIKIDC
jgi:hypothetical protein